jgi:hypothetical protein
MKRQTRIHPEKITRPFQLLAAWLSGLILIDGSFLMAASQIRIPEWAAGLLVIMSVVNVPLFLTSIFLLQTKFRPEMQEDIYYSKYLEQKYSTEKNVISQFNLEEQAMKKLVDNIVKEIGPAADHKKQQVEQLVQNSDILSMASGIGENRTLSELYLYPEKWSKIVGDYIDDYAFNADIESLVEGGLVVMKRGDLRSCELTARGRQIAELAEKNSNLWHQRRGGYVKRKEE